MGVLGYSFNVAVFDDYRTEEATRIGNHDEYLEAEPSCEQPMHFAVKLKLTSIVSRRCSFPSSSAASSASTFVSNPLLL
jgi:hypothetical protein